MTSNDGMESITHEMRLCWCAIEIWVLCQDMDGRLKNPHALRLCADLTNFEYLPEERLYASGHTGLSMGPRHTIQYFVFDNSNIVNMHICYIYIMMAIQD